MALGLLGFCFKYLNKRPPPPCGPPCLCQFLLRTSWDKAQGSAGALQTAAAVGTLRLDRAPVFIFFCAFVKSHLGVLAL